MATCVICLEDIEKNEKIVCINGCDHIVHSACFFAYAQYQVQGSKSVVCPMCRHVVIDIPQLQSSLPPPQTQQVDVEYRFIDDEALDQEKKKLKTVITLCVIVFGLNAMYLVNEIFLPQ